MPIKLGNTYPEARDAVLLQRNSTVQPVFQRGIWTQSGTNKIATFTDNPDFNVQSYSFAVTLKRLQNNASSYTGIIGLAYTTGQTDNFFFGMENSTAGTNVYSIILRLNDYSALAGVGLTTNSTIKIVGVYNGTFGTIYYGSNSVSGNVTRPLNTRPRFYVNENHPDYEVTNYGWWLRELSIQEKNDYMNGNMKAFQIPV